jgi:hypothetical protein
MIGEGLERRRKSALPNAVRVVLSIASSFETSGSALCDAREVGDGRFAILRDPAKQLRVRANRADLA